MERAFYQFLRSLAQAGIRELPKGNDAIRESLQQSIEVTRQQPDALNNGLRTEALEPEQATDSAPDEPKGLHAQATHSTGPERAGALHQNTGGEYSQDRDSTTVMGDDAVREVKPSTPTNIDKPARLDILKNKVANCFRCAELVENRTQTVFGVGNPNPRLCFLGEAPGADEDLKGEPFVGAAGKLLDRIIAACKMDRSDVYILNTIKCRPPNNRNPTEDECDSCRSFLDEQLSILQPEFICCLGGIAAKHLLDSPLSVGRLRGQLHQHQIEGLSPIKVVVTYHPAYLLRNEGAKKHVWNDMKFLMSEMGHAIS